MLDENQLSSVVSNVIDTIKKCKKGESPNYFYTYHERVEMMERIKIHSELCKFPHELIKKAAPRQTAEEFSYLKENFKQVTLPVYLDFLNTVNRVFSDTSWSINYNKEDEFQKYVERDVPIYGSIEGFMKNILAHLKLTDANGLICIKPHKLETEIIEEDGDFMEVIPADASIEPIPVYYSSKQIVAESFDEWYIVLLNEKSKVNRSGKVVQDGLIFEYYDEEKIVRIEQYGEKNEYTFFQKDYFVHNYGKVPAFKLKGNPVIRETEVMFSSPFIFAVDLLDLCTLNHCLLQTVLYRVGYPHTVMLGSPCEFEYTDSIGNKSVCDSGWIFDSAKGKVECPHCHGSGLKSRLSPMGAMLINPGTNTSPGDTKLNTSDPLKFISPETSAMDFMIKKIEWDENKARRILHIQSSSDNAKGTPDLATTQVLEHKAMDAFIRPISFQLFDLYENILNTIGYFIKGENFTNVSMSYPVTFDFYTESDYIKQISDAKAAGLPPIVIHTIIYRYLQNMYYNDGTTAMVFNLIATADRLLTMDNIQIQAGLSRGTIEKWESILHDSAITLVDLIIIQDENFFQNSLQDQVKILKDKAKEFVSNIVPITSNATRERVSAILNGSQA